MGRAKTTGKLSYPATEGKRAGKRERVRVCACMYEREIKTDIQTDRETDRQRRVIDRGRER